KIINIIYCRYCGVWPLQPSAHILLKILHFIFRTFNYVVMAIHLASVLAPAIYHKGDLVVLGDVGGWLIGGSMSFLKFVKFTASYNSIIDHIEKVLIPIDILQQ
ncbi:GSCOCT00013834001.3-RA-CDS, partial [Cotesia congregata]